MTTVAPNPSKRLLASVLGTTSECMGCRRRVATETLVFIPFLGTFCPPCGTAKQQEIAQRSKQ